MRGRWDFLLLGLVLAAVGCGSDSTALSSTFAVIRIQPPASGAPSDEPEELFLNQEITVRFNRPIDSASITEDTVRVTDAEGRRVDGQLRIHSHSVTFVPVAPLQPTLDDGSFRPGQRYAIEVVGFPRANAVRSAEGELLEHSTTRSFQAVAADTKPSPLLHERTPPFFAFVLDDRMLRRAADSRSVELYFHEQPMPLTVSPAAFKLWAMSGGQPTAFAPAAAKLHRLPPSYTGLPGWMVELELDRDPGDYLCVELVAEPELALRDNSGALPRLLKHPADGTPEIVDLVGQPVHVLSFPGTRVPLLGEDFSGGTQFHTARSGSLGFETTAERATPRVRIDAGTGALGVFHPQRPTDLKPNQPFDRGDGEVVSANGSVFDFSDFVIPRGVTVRLRALPAPIRAETDGEILQIRSCGEIRIDGDLVLDATPLVPAGPFTQAHRPKRCREVVAASGVALLAAGDIVVQGAIRREGPEPRVPMSAVTLISGGDVWLVGGAVPPHSMIATERTRFRGEAQETVDVVGIAPMVRELPSGIALEARAWTDWLPLPDTRHRRVEIELSEVFGDIGVHAQVAPPDPAHPGRPSRDVLHAPVPVPLSAPLPVPPGGFIRFLLEGRVEGGVPLPSLGGLTVFGT